LKVSLTSHDPGTPYGKPLQALGSGVPFEYCDGTRKVECDGLFKILNSNRVE
jgi:hypothetical protein